MNKDFFLNHFPVPNFLKMPAIGFDISDGSVRYVELIEKNGKKVLGRYGRIKMPKGTVIDGDIKDKIKLVNILKEIKKKNDFEFVRISVIEKNSYIFKTVVPYKKGASRDEILGALSFKLEENVPLSAEDAFFDFDVLNEKDGQIEVIVSVLPRKIVDQFLEVFEASGMTPISFEVEAQAVARSSIAKGDMGTNMIVDFRSTRASISIVSEGLVQMTSTIDVGGDDLIAAIQKSENVTEAEAEKIKKEKGFKRVGYDDALFYAMMNTITVLKDEISKYVMYWATHHRNELIDKDAKGKVSKIILCGENGSLRSLDDYLSLSLGLNIEKALVWRNLFSLDDAIPDMDFFTSLEYAAAVGLAMRHDNDVFSFNVVNLDNLENA